MIIIKLNLNVHTSHLTQDQAARDKALAGLSSMSSAQIVSASILQNTASSRMFGTPGKNICVAKCILVCVRCVMCEGSL